MTFVFSFIVLADDDVIVISADKSQGQKGKILTGDSNTDNSIVSGVLGFGLGVGGVLIAQSFLESQNKGGPCRHRRDTGVQPRFIGGLGGGGGGGGLGGLDY